MTAVGRMLEAIGVVLAPLALVVGLKSGSGRIELALLACAALLFWVGRRLTRAEGA